jgi:ribosomal protein L7Ae-like RNA K-turn-binding protein
LLVDYRSKLPGRGAYTCVARECIIAAIKQNGFSRAFKKSIAVVDAENLLQMVVQSLNARILNLIGIARKAGAIVTGSNSVLQELGKSTAYLLIVANDAAAGTADKVLNKAKGCEVPCIRLFDKRKLGSTVGRDERSHVVVTNKKFAKNLILEIDRLMNIAGEN